MPKPCRTHHRIAATVAAAYAGLALTSTAGAVDLRDWGRKYNIASERFVVLTSFNNEAVLDKETQLVWHRSKGSAYVWSIAVTRCHASNAGDRAGWRLPSISELRSLAGTGGVLPASHPFQNITDQHLIWSSTDAGATTHAYVVNLMTGGWGTGNKTNAYYHLCVRGSGAADR